MWNRATSVSAGILTVAVLALCAAAQAQQAGGAMPAPGESRVVMDWKEFKAISKFDEARLEADKDKFAIPWQDVKNLFGIEIKDVNTAELKLPWKEFKTLLEWSIKEAERKKKEAEKDEPAPVPYLINSIEFVGDNLKTDGAMFKATYKIDVFEKKGWKKIMVLPGDVAVKTATLPAGVFLQLENKNYYLLTKNAEAMTVTIEFSVAVTEAAGSSTLGFTKPPASTCILDVTVPEKNVDVKIAGAQSKLSKQEADKTHVVAALPADSRVNVSWERAIPEVEKVPPKIFSETRTLISVADGILLGHSQISFNILHTATRQLALNVPEGVNILEVTAPNMRDWRATTGKLNLSLAKEVIGSYAVDVKYEVALPAATEKVSVPVITASGVELEKGHIGVEALTNVEISGDVAEGAHTVDVKDLPPEIPGMTAQPILIAYRYVTPSFKIGLKIGKHENVAVLLTVIDSAHFTVMQTLDGRRITKGVYNVRNNRNQFLRLQMPPAAELWSATVSGKATQPARDTAGSILLPLVRSQGSGGLSAFPVEIVYVEEGTKPDPKGRGAAKVSLPSSSEPITHLMVDLYVPKEGEYSNFEGTLRKVDAFTQVGAPAPAVNVAEEAQALQQQMVTKQAAKVSAAGASPIEVELPVSGQVFHFEKILVIKDAQWFSYDFRNVRGKWLGMF